MKYPWILCRWMMSGVDVLYLFDKLTCSRPGNQSVVVEQSALYGMLVHIPLASNPKELRLARRVATAEGYATSPSILDGHLFYFLYDAVRRTLVAGYVDLEKYLHNQYFSYTMILSILYMSF